MYEVRELSYHWLRRARAVLTGIFIGVLFSVLFELHFLFLILLHFLGFCTFLKHSFKLGNMPIPRLFLLWVERHTTGSWIKIQTANVRVADLARD